MCVLKYISFEVFVFVYICCVLYSFIMFKRKGMLEVFKMRSVATTCKQLKLIDI